MKILITGAGGPAGICFAKSLSQIEGIDLVSADATDSLLARKFSKTFYLVPIASNRDYISSLQKIIKTEKIDFLIPTVDEELGIVSENLNNLDCKVLISPSETIKLTTDKGNLYKVLSFVLPKRYTKLDAVFPVFVKPKRGRGSRDIHQVESKTKLDLYSENEYVIQEVLQGREVTVDTLFDFDGRLTIVVPRIRTKTEEGISVMGKVVKNIDIIDKVKKISEVLKFVGPVNFQFMSGEHGFKLIEINARSSGGMGITINSGIDIPKLAYELIQNKTLSNIPNITEGDFLNFQEIIERQEVKKLNKTK